jgi:hypothetical protein
LSDSPWIGRPSNIVGQWLTDTVKLPVIQFSSSTCFVLLYRS